MYVSRFFVEAVQNANQNGDLVTTSGTTYRKI